jgi:hypothetical protein
MCKTVAYVCLLSSRIHFLNKLAFTFSARNVLKNLSRLLSSSPTFIWKYHIICIKQLRISASKTLFSTVAKCLWFRATHLSLAWVNSLQKSFWKNKWKFSRLLHPQQLIDVTIEF